MSSGSEAEEPLALFTPKGEEAEAVEDTVFDEMLADPTLMVAPRPESHTGPHVDTLFTGPPLGQGAPSTEGASGVTELGWYALGGSSGASSHEVGLDTPLEAITCGPIEAPRAKRAPPLVHRRLIATLALERARDPIGEVAIGGVGAAAPLEAVTSLRKAEGQDESGTSSAEETPQPAGPTGAKKLRWYAPTRGRTPGDSSRRVSRYRNRDPCG